MKKMECDKCGIEAELPSNEKSLFSWQKEEFPRGWRGIRVYEGNKEIIIELCPKCNVVLDKIILVWTNKIKQSVEFK